METNRKEMITEPKAGKIFNFFKKKRALLRRMTFKLPKFVGGVLFKERTLRHYAWGFLKSKLYYENIMRYRCKKLGENFHLFGELPFMEGDGDIYIGNNVTMYGHVVMFTGGHIYKDSEIRIGDNCSIGFGVQFRAAKKISVGKNCMIAGGVRISDNDGHPIGIHRDGRVSPEDVKPVIIEDGVWIGENSAILKGVTIGRGCIISTGSVLGRSVPPMKIAMGNPARVAMWVPGSEGEAHATDTGENCTDQKGAEKRVLE